MIGSVRFSLHKFCNIESLKKSKKITEPQLDDLDAKLFEFLDKESTYGLSRISNLKTDASNELFNKDILKD